MWPWLIKYRMCVCVCNCVRACVCVNFLFQGCMPGWAQVWTCERSLNSFFLQAQHRYVTGTHWQCHAAFCQNICAKPPTDHCLTHSVLQTVSTHVTSSVFLPSRSTAPPCPQGQARVLWPRPQTFHPRLPPPRPPWRSAGPLSPDLRKNSSSRSLPPQLTANSQCRQRLKVYSTWVPLVGLVVVLVHHRMCFCHRHQPETLFWAPASHRLWRSHLRICCHQQHRRYHCVRKETWTRMRKTLMAIRWFQAGLGRMSVMPQM